MILGIVYSGISGMDHCMGHSMVFGVVERDEWNVEWNWWDVGQVVG